MKIKFLNNKSKIKPILPDYFFHFNNINNSPYKIKGNILFKEAPQNPLLFYKVLAQLDKDIIEMKANDSFSQNFGLKADLITEKIKKDEDKKLAYQLFNNNHPQNYILKFVMDNYITNKDRKNFIMSKNLCTALLKAPHAPNLSILPFKVGGDYYLEFPKIQIDNYNLVGAMISIFEESEVYGFSSAFFFETSNGDLDFRTIQWKIQKETLELIKNTPNDSLEGSHKIEYDNFKLRKFSWWEKLIKKDEYEMFLKAKKSYEELSQSSKEIINDPVLMFLFNSLLFIHNADALNFEKNFFKKEAEKTKQTGSLETICVLGEDFKNVRYSSTTHTEVSSHFRWQPYGSKMDKYKLIKIESYTKKNTIPLFDEESLEDKKQPFRELEKEARDKFDETLLPLAKMNNFLVQTEVRVSLDTLHKVDYTMMNDKYLIAIEYKSDKAKWSYDKIEIQRRFYQKSLSAMYPNHQVHTFLVSDMGKYGLSHNDFIQELSKIIEEGIKVPDLNDLKYFNSN